MVMTSSPEDTIAAIATPPGEGGVAIIRISGSGALAVAQKIFSRSLQGLPSHTAHYGQILDEKRRVVDNVLLLLMIAPRSYTGEDTVEIHCHGGALISRRVLCVVYKAGARPAQAGEFTMRAYLNNRMDLAQAEAVQELIFAKNELALQAAENQLQGRLSQAVRSFQTKLTELAAILEAWVDFPEEGLEFATFDEMLHELQTVQDEMQKLADTFHDGKIAREGVSLCLVGPPNAGKSSLMNALLDKERAIVTPIEGTTRDVLEESFRLNGLNLRLIDTAGLRQTEEIVEKEGMRRTQLALKEADIALLVLDGTKEIPQDLPTLPLDKTIALFNKADLPQKTHSPLPYARCLKISAQKKWGLQDLKNALEEMIWEKGPPSGEETLLTQMRHYQALQKAISSVQRVRSSLQENTSPEFLMIDMREALQELGQIIGCDVSQDILDAIFSRFCIGK